MSEQDEIQIEQLPDEDNSATLTANYKTIAQIAKEMGQTYENLRRKIAKLSKEPNFKEHIIQQKNSLNRNVTYIDEYVVEFIKNNKRNESIFIDAGEETIRELNIKIKLIEEDKTRLQNENNAYSRKINELQEKIINMQEHPELALDTSKYILLEDHAKIEEKLAETEKELSDEKSKNQELSEKNASLEKDNEDLREISIKAAKLTNEVNEKSKLISEKEENILTLRQEKLDIEEKRRKAEEEKFNAEREKQRVEEDKQKLEAEFEESKKEAEEEKQRFEREYEEVLSLGFFARRKKLKELKKKKSTQ